MHDKSLCLYDNGMTMYDKLYYNGMTMYDKLYYNGMTMYDKLYYNGITNVVYLYFVGFVGQFVGQIVCVMLDVYTCDRICTYIVYTILCVCIYNLYVCVHNVYTIMILSVFHGICRTICRTNCLCNVGCTYM